MHVSTAFAHRYVLLQFIVALILYVLKASGFRNLAETEALSVQRDFVASTSAYSSPLR